MTFLHTQSNKIILERVNWHQEQNQRHSMVATDSERFSIDLWFQFCEGFKEDVPIYL